MPVAPTNGIRRPTKGGAAMTRIHPLDRPVWSALTGRQANLAQGGALALRLDPQYGVFGAASNDSPESVRALASLVPGNGRLATVEGPDWPEIEGLVTVQREACYQMIAERLEPRDIACTITPLVEADMPEMWNLVALTKPGPFAERTHELGDFVGVKLGDRVVAMTGERMKPHGFTEVSGVCTLPEYRGRGYAGALIHAVAARILARGEVPFLHVSATNAGAIAVYRSLGFTVRHTLQLTVLTRR